MPMINAPQLATAQDGTSARLDPERIVLHVQQQLHLDDAQTSAVRSIIAEAIARLGELDANASDEARRTHLRGVIADASQRIRPLLRDDQLARFDGLVARIRAQLE